MKVEEERGGRLARLDELATNLKCLERLTLDNSSYLDENIRVHALWTAVRAMQAAVDGPERKPFREELHVLRHITAAKEDLVVSTALNSLESTEVPDVGVEPLADLTSWFTTSVAPRVSSVALVPDQDAGILSHLASHLLTSFSFRKRGLTPGNDVLSVLSRAEYYLNEQDLDTAARELNQLTGTAKELLYDWLEAARRRLEVQQALEVCQSGLYLLMSLTCTTGNTNRSYPRLITRRIDHGYKYYIDCKPVLSLYFWLMLQGRCDARANVERTFAQDLCTPHDYLTIILALPTRTGTTFSHLDEPRENSRPHPIDLSPLAFQTPPYELNVVG